MEAQVGDVLAAIPPEAQELVRQAIEFALECHAGQIRPGGEPQASHLLRVGLAAAEYAYDHALGQAGILVPAAVLHDVLEDTPTTDEELAARFGAEVAHAVRGLSHDEEEEPDEVYLSRVAAAGQCAVLVKRFDRLDNLRTLRNAPPEFRARKCAEVQAALPIWHRIDPEGAGEIERLLLEVCGS